MRGLEVIAAAMLTTILYTQTGATPVEDTSLESRSGARIISDIVQLFGDGLKTGAKELDKETPLWYVISLWMAQYKNSHTITGISKNSKTCVTFISNLPGLEKTTIAAWSLSSAAMTITRRNIVRTGPFIRLLRSASLMSGSKTQVRGLEGMSRKGSKFLQRSAHRRVQRRVLRNE